MRPEFLPAFIESVSDEFLDFDGTQISIVETSHRNKHFVKQYNKSDKQVRKFLKVPKEFSILWMQSEVELQYAAICMNLLKYSDEGVCQSR